MYHINQSQIKNNQFKYGFTKSNNKKLTYEEFINLLKLKDKEFLKIFREALKKVANELSAYFWECIPVSSNTISKEFEFVVTKNEELDNIVQNYSEFQGYINESLDNYATSFLSLHKNATLIIPLPQKNQSLNYNDKICDYKNLKEFINNSSLEQWEAFGQKVGEKMEKNLLNARGATRGLSTSGLNIHYLHVRINNSPRHYSHTEYLKEAETPQARW